MEKLVDALCRDYPHLNFNASDAACWSPVQHQVSYSIKGEPSDCWSLLHELGHALLGHRSYQSDADLLQKEAQAWDKAVALGRRYGVAIEADHIQNCLDTYRDWLHQRSTCPTCGNHGLQQSKALYRCLNCQGTWTVTSSRFCRPYRLKKALAQ